MPPLLATWFLAAIGGGALLRGWRRVRGTTLTAAWCWAWLALAAVVACETLLAGDEVAHDSFSDTLRYLAYTLPLAPVMAILGAKRPQHGAWQWIVLSLLVVVWLPWGQAWLFRSAASLATALHPAVRVFLAILASLALWNYLPTRSWPLGAGYSLGQWLLLAEFLGVGSAADWPWTRVAGQITFAATALWTLRPRRPAREARSADVAWRSFRDTFGGLWALRIQERVNAELSRGPAPLRLAWTGFRAEPADGRPLAWTADLEAAAADALQLWLNRFVARAERAA